MTEEFVMPSQDEVRRIVEKAALIIGSDYRNIGVVEAALDWQQQQMMELKAHRRSTFSED